jgi:Fe-S cluster assembly iron-binding protein IscA
MWLLTTQAEHRSVLWSSTDSAQHLAGVTDFKDGLQGAGFAIRPERDPGCGCGQSFS